MTMKTTLTLIALAAFGGTAVLAGCGPASTGPDTAGLPDEPKPRPEPNPRPPSPTPEPRPGPTDTGDPPPVAPPNSK
jgi:hypothetical protein